MHRALALVLVLSGLLVGCGRGTFVGRSYNNFTAYYNTFYNAQKAFDKGIASVSQSDSQVDRARYISIFPDPQTGSSGAFEEAIQKSADLLRQYPNSKWVDDALMLIGRSRYYQQNYVGAAQKFREVMALGTEREREARFRLAQTLVAADRYAEAVDVLRTGLEGADRPGTWTARMRLVRGELSVRRQEWAAAEAALQQGLEGPLPDETGARAAFLLGQVRETREDFEGAQAAYDQVRTYNSPYQLEFAARLGAIEMLGRSGNPEAALRRLDDLERGDDTKVMRGKIVITRARLYRAVGQPQEAERILKNVLRGEEAPSGTVEGRVHYDLASLYRDSYEDYTRAAAHYDTASTTLRSGATRGSEGAAEEQLLPRAPSDAAQQAERFRGLADRARAVARMDSLLRLGELPPSEFRAFVKKLRRKRAERRQQQAQNRRQQQFRRGSQQRLNERGRQSAEPAGAVQTRSSDAGFLFHRDPTLVQEGQRQFQQTWGDRPLVDNWRRRTAIQGSTPAAATQEEASRTSSPAGENTPSERLVDVSEVPRDSAGRAQMRTELAVAQYELANALFRAAGRPDSAETWFRRILEDTSDHPVVRQALYGLAQAHRAQGDSSAAEDAYRRLIEEYPDTRYATRAREQLGLRQSQSTTDPTASRADSAYARAFEVWQDGHVQKALGKFFSVARSYPETSAASRALLAAGVAYRRAPPEDSSDGLRATFRRHVDSLVYVPGDSSSAVPKADTARKSRPAARSRPSPPPDSVAARERSQSPSDTTAPRRESPTRVPMRPSRADSTSPETPTRFDSIQSDTMRQRPTPPALDSTTASKLQGPAQQREQDGRRVPDSLSTAAGRSDSDSTEAQPVAVRDSTQTRTSGDPPESPFKTLLTHVVEAYEGSPAAERAQSLLDHLRRRRAAADSPTTPPSADSTIRQAPSAAADTGSAAPSQSPDTTAIPSRASQQHPVSDTTGERLRRPTLQRPQDSSSTPTQDTTTGAGPSTSPPVPSDTTTEEPRSDTTEVDPSSLGSALRSYRAGGTKEKNQRFRASSNFREGKIVRDGLSTDLVVRSTLGDGQFVTDRYEVIRRPRRGIHPPLHHVSV